MSSFSCEVLNRHPYNKSRVTHIKTPHGDFMTPVFMPVGTRAGVNNMTPFELKQAGSQIILGGNTYHMLCAPGMDIIKQAGGMHPFMGWHGPMLTDSGGFQIFSLSKNSTICTIDEEGAHFKLPNTTKVLHMTPQTSLATQNIIGADIIMAFDQCTPDSCNKEAVRSIMNRTHRWLKQSVACHQQNPFTPYGNEQALFGIVQGGLFEDLRKESAEFVSSMQVQGIAIGGETIGFDMQATVEVLKWVSSYFADNKPRYTMGVGMSPQDLLDVVAEGVDMFDCVAPTRNARHGALYCGELVSQGSWLRFVSEYENQRIQIKKNIFANQDLPVMTTCCCYTCKFYSRAHLHYLFKQKAPVFTALASMHNVHVLHSICEAMRNLIARKNC